MPNLGSFPPNLPGSDGTDMYVHVCVALLPGEKNFVKMMHAKKNQ